MKKKPPAQTGYLVEHLPQYHRKRVVEKVEGEDPTSIAKREATKIRKKRYKISRTMHARTRRKNQEIADKLRTPPAKGGCTHPRFRARGVCQRDAIGEFDVPDDYQPLQFVRHVGQPDIPRPRAALCTQHAYLVQAYTAGTDETPKEIRHKAQCPVCNHPNRALVDRTERSWCKWWMTTKEACAELGISVLSWNSHVTFYGLDEDKLSKRSTNQLLIDIAEKGSRSGTHTVRDALKAIDSISKARGDAENININARVATIDLTQLSDEELALRLEQAAKQVKESKDTKRLEE